MTEQDNRIEAGDIVNIYWDNLMMSAREEINATVLYTPQDTGDVWGFRTARGGIFYQNPMSASLDRIELVKKGERE